MTDRLPVEPDIRSIDARLRQLADGPPRWGMDPLLEAGVRPEAVDALVRTVRLYAESDRSTRERLRGLFRECEAFAWAATLPEGASVRDRLVHWSLLDQGRDSRDAILELDDICAAGAAVTDLREVAELSSDEDHYGMGSSRAQLLGRI